MINLISDTVTKPTPEMLRAMMQAEVGDDVFRQDPTVNALEGKAAKLFGMESALFCPSGTMTNQIAINVHTQQLDEIICDETSHIYQYELGGYGFHSGVSIKLLPGDFGKISAAQVDQAVNPEYDWLPSSRLVVLENTCNKGGGNFYSLEEFQAIHKVCQNRNLKIHLDGARLFNALVETGDTTEAIGSCFDSISICLSKGLGAPVGSLLLGTEVFIKRARKIRKVMGGGMRQAGYLAAAGIYALDHHIERLRADNDHAKLLGKVLTECAYVERVKPVKTNIVIFDLKAPYDSNKFLELLADKGIAAAPFGAKTVRFCTHLDVNKEMIEKVISVLKSI